MTKSHFAHTRPMEQLGVPIHSASGYWPVDVQGGPSVC